MATTTKDLSATPAAKTIRPFIFNKRTVVCLPREFVERYGISEDDTEFEIQAVEGGFYWKLLRRGGPSNAA